MNIIEKAFDWQQTEDVTKHLNKSIKDNNWGKAKILFGKQKVHSLLDRYVKSDKILFGLAKGFINVIEINISDRTWKTNVESSYSEQCKIFSTYNTDIKREEIKAIFKTEYVVILVGKGYDGRLESMYYKFRRWCEENEIPINYYYSIAPTRMKFLEERKIRFYQELRYLNDKKWKESINKFNSDSAYNPSTAANYQTVNDKNADFLLVI